MDSALGDFEQKLQTAQSRGTGVGGDAAIKLLFRKLNVMHTSLRGQLDAVEQEQAEAEVMQQKLSRYGLGHSPGPGVALDVVRGGQRRPGPPRLCANAFRVRQAARSPHSALRCLA